jgi:mannose-1-phosphate guanylyltransferase
MNTELSAILIVADDKNDLWPLERPRLPFSCLPFFGGLTLLESAWQRLTRAVKKERIWLLSPPQACAAVQELLPEAAGENIIPSELGTLAAVHTLTEMLHERGREGGDFTLVSRAAMVAGDEENFARMVEDAARLAKASDCLIGCGVPAKEARPGYDYLITGEGCVQGAHVSGRDVRAFLVDVDKQETRQAYQTGNAWWNVGIYVWPNTAFLSEYAARSHELAADPERRETVSLEEGLLAHTKNILLLGATLVFSPLRNYEDIARYIRQDVTGNVKTGNVALHNSKSCFAYNAARERLLVASGLEDILLVQTEDAVFVCPRGDEGAIRFLIEELAKKDPRLLKYIE